MSYEETKYTVGDVFIRKYNGMDWLCILMSRDYEGDPHNKYVWRSTMLPIFESGLAGGETAIHYEEDLDRLAHVGRIFVSKERAQQNHGVKMDLRCWWCGGTEGKFTSFGSNWKIVHWQCIPKIVAAKHRIHLNSIGVGMRARLGGWFVSLGNRIAKNGDT